jgi:O-antigen ligase
MFIVMINVVRTEGRLRWMLWIALAVSITTSISAISDYQTGHMLTGGVRIKGSIGGLFENPNDLALHLVTILPLAVSLFLASRGLFKKIVYVAASVLMVAAIICTFSRGGFLGLIAVALVLAWKLGRKNRKTVIIVSLLIIVALVVFAPAQYGGRLTSIWGGDATGSANARQELFWRSLLVAIRYPIFGVGIGNFHFRSLHEQVSHNSFTQVASELGLAALVFYVLFMLTPLKRLRLMEKETLGLKEKARFYYLSVGLQASLVGYMVDSFFASVAFLWYVYYLVGYAVCFSRLYATSTSKDQPATSETAPLLLGERLPGVQGL